MRNAGRRGAPASAIAALFEMEAPRRLAVEQAWRRRRNGLCAISPRGLGLGLSFDLLTLARGARACTRPSSPVEASFANRIAGRSGPALRYAIALPSFKTASTRASRPARAIVSARPRTRTRQRAVGMDFEWSCRWNAPAGAQARDHRVGSVQPTSLAGRKRCAAHCPGAQKSQMPQRLWPSATSPKWRTMADMRHWSLSA